ncbi:uncharacterized protein K452DRAFT_278869 [Aplosporella prunicola CBS 121167]|uniref:Ribosomal protein L22 n=1 Tax=Aplosporella prunicola CBS 121167 TaxID=1176127 RepID=A0A6A6B3B5_9PEZI|nr:uncharacterized protein K452DRAFT_278869 [Aplosporella prunicola CBS 121167]KAF2137221.1 hypothetical protein K452DRAFT_278869 [Aplosporella prunicola CBS 121167]
MSLPIRSRCLPRPAALPAAVTPPVTARRTFISDLWNSLRPRNKNQQPQDPRSEKQQPKNPLLEEYMRNKPKSTRPELQRGDLTDSSIFADEAKAPTETPEERRAREAEAKKNEPRNPAAMAAALDPAPHARQRWERKMAIREVRQRGRVSKTVQLKRTEREDLQKSSLIKTSVKKLGMLARQIAGKPIDDAITQMRFSKKKAAKSVLEHLQYARDHAVVSRGMGLGEATGTKGEPTEIELKDGRRKLVTDRTGIYVDQAWVGRGQYGRAYDIRARGMVNVMRIPSTSISVVLKEEATRIRLSQEKQKKRDNRKVWQPLPDRPVTRQRQHLMW